VFCALSEVYGGLLDVRLDRGIPESFQYFKEGAIATMLVWVFFRTRRHIFLGWACLFLFLLLDDSLQYHERMGALLTGFPGVASLASSLDVRPDDIGEMLSLVPVLAALAIFMPIPYFRERPEGRRIVHIISILVVALVLMGGVMDLADRAAFTRGSSYVSVLSLIEDGGEMIVMSSIFGYVSAVWRRLARPSFT
jgi:hypothetical protein